MIRHRIYSDTDANANPSNGVLYVEWERLLIKISNKSKKKKGRYF